MSFVSLSCLRTLQEVRCGLWRLPSIIQTLERHSSLKLFTFNVPSMRNLPVFKRLNFSFLKLVTVVCVV